MFVERRKRAFRSRTGAQLGMVLALATSASLSLWSPSATAQSPSEIAQAKQWFAQGLALEDKGQFAEALSSFQKALGVKQTPQIQFHVGLCQLKVGALAEALVSLESALESATSEGNAQVQSAATSELSALRPRVPKLEISVTGGEQPASVALDGKSLDESRLATSISLNPGQHEIVAQFAGGEVRKTFAVAEGGSTRVELSPPLAAPSDSTVSPPVAPAPADEPAALPPKEPAPAPAPAASSPVLPWVLVGSGVVLAAGGFYSWKLRGDQIDELDSICPTQESCPSDRESEVDDLEGKGRTYSALAIGLWGVGAAALATGGYLLLDADDEKADSARIAPSIGPGLAGAIVSGRF